MGDISGIDRGGGAAAIIMRVVPVAEHAPVKVEIAIEQAAQRILLHVLNEPYLPPVITCLDAQLERYDREQRGAQRRHGGQAGSGDRDVYGRGASGRKALHIAHDGDGHAHFEKRHDAGPDRNDQQAVLVPWGQKARNRTHEIAQLP
jgi:hypothetical protein